MATVPEIGVPRGNVTRDSREVGAHWSGPYRCTEQQWQKIQRDMGEDACRDDMGAMNLGEWYDPDAVIGSEGRGLSTTAMGDSRWIECTDVDGKKRWKRRIKSGLMETAEGEQSGTPWSGDSTRAEQKLTVEQWQKVRRDMGEDAFRDSANTIPVSGPETPPVWTQMVSPRGMA